MINLASFLSGFIYTSYNRPQTNILLCSCFSNTEYCARVQSFRKNVVTSFCVAFSYVLRYLGAGLIRRTKRGTKQCNYIWWKSLSHLTFLDMTMTTNYGWTGNLNIFINFFMIQPMVYNVLGTINTLFHHCNISSIVVSTVNSVINNGYSLTDHPTFGTE